MSLSNTIVNSLLMNMQISIPKVVVYTVRLQPLHMGNILTYRHLVEKFGKENVYIATDIKPTPLLFEEKVKIATTFCDIDESHIIPITDYNDPAEVTCKFNRNEVSYIKVTNSHNAARLDSDYYEPYSETKDLLPILDRGYYYIPPDFFEYSSKDVREKLGSAMLSLDVKKTYFEKFYPEFNKEIFDMLVHRFTQYDVLNWVQNRKGNLFEFVGPDDGPGFVYPNYAAYKGATKADLVNFLKTGWEIINHLVDDDKEIKLDDTRYPNGPVDSVSYFPAGDFDVQTPMNQQDIYGIGAYNKWKTHIGRSVALLGWEYAQSKQQERLTKSLSAKDAAGIKQAKRHTVSESVDESTASSVGATDFKSLFNKIPKYGKGGFDDVIDNFIYDVVSETIKRVGDKWVVYPKKGGDRLGTHDTKEDALKQLAAIEASKDEAIDGKPKPTPYGSGSGMAFNNILNIPDSELGGADGDGGGVGEEVEGGLADNMTISDIAEKHGVSVEDIEYELEMGIEVEMEHTNDEELAREIAMDHLVEMPDYYTKLSAMENELSEFIFNEDEESDNKTHIYESYYSNLAPSTHKVSSIDGNIIIKTSADN